MIGFWSALRVATDWVEIAGKVVEDAVGALPPEIRAVAKAIPILLEEEMPKHLIDDGWEPDLLGMFDGADVGEEEAGQARILIFLRNIVDFVEGDTGEFREEVRVTLLHELGHLLGLDEEDLVRRGLE
ncbi:MAG: metallopeptidase family protein [Verrucomicrobiota bacterium]